MSIDPKLYPDSYFDGLHRVTRFAATERKWQERDRDILRLVSPSQEMTVVDLGSARGDVCFLLSPLVREAIGVRCVADGRPDRGGRIRPDAAFRTCDSSNPTSPNAPEFRTRPSTSPQRSICVEHIDDATVVAMLRACRADPEARRIFAAYTPNREHYVERLKAHNFILKQFPEHIAVRRPRELAALLGARRLPGHGAELVRVAVSLRPARGTMSRSDPGARTTVSVSDSAAGETGLAYELIPAFRNRRSGSFTNVGRRCA